MAEDNEELKQLKSIRVHLAMSRRIVAATFHTPDSKEHKENVARKVADIQNQIEVIDRAIADEVGIAELGR